MPKFKITQGVITRTNRTVTIEAETEEKAITDLDYLPDWEWNDVDNEQEIVSQNVKLCE